MAPLPTYAGALMPKKKQELQDIATALKISGNGTKDDLQSRIKKHLELNPELEENPQFTGLFNSKGRRRSVQPQMQPQPPVQPLIPSSRLAPLTSETIKTSSSPTRRVSALDPVIEATPDVERHDVSMFLKNPMSPGEEEEESPEESRQISNVAPQAQSLLPLPSSPEKAPEPSLVQQIPEQISVHFGALSARIKNAEVTQNVTQNSVETIAGLRHFLSNSQNLWTLTAVAELMYVIGQVVPWRVNEVPIATIKENAVTLPLYYPPLATFQTSSFWLTLLHCALPTLILPAIFGHLISFSPRTLVPSAGPSASPRQTPPTPSGAPLDFLTVAIVRLAAQLAYPYAKVNQTLHGVDVIGPQYRILNASICLAFAFAEAILGQPQAFVRAISAERRYNRLLEGSPAPETPTIRRRAIMHRDSDSQSREID